MPTRCTVSQIYLIKYVLYIFRTGPLSSIHPVADANRTTSSMTNTCCCVYSVEILLMMDSGHVRNM
jgi:hypothetical protein